MLKQDVHLMQRSKAYIYIASSGKKYFWALIFGHYFHFFIFTQYAATGGSNKDNLAVKWLWAPDKTKVASDTSFRESMPITYL